MSAQPFEHDFKDTGPIAADRPDVDQPFDQTTRDEMEQLAARYPDRRSALGPILHLVQSVDGYVSARGLAAAAAVTGISPAQVQGFATFYTMYRRHPAGQHHIGVCTTALCAVLGGDAVLERVRSRLGIAPDQTTPDGRFSLERVECNAACDYAPVVMVDWEFMDNMTPEKAEQLIDQLAAGEPVQASRGATLAGWRQAERVLAGFDDGLADEGPSAGEPSRRGTEIAASRGWTADTWPTVGPTVGPAAGKDRP
ncbi:MAG: NADH-quinone oxidoreductase subunit NuoE [Propionibacteriaceae bacterium]|jgi:NADH-quinone oxidoreductase subunit E|nr:NADH-quinone oxidoreductase subunit NuoE [Propionibacteriaceae bacterium]